MINNKEKQAIAETLKMYVARHDSQNKAANTLKGVSNAIVSQVLNGKWEKISDEMWRKIYAQIDGKSEAWKTVTTRDFRDIYQILSDAQTSSQVFAMTGAAGSGKSKALKEYANSNSRAYLLCCNEYWNRKYFLAELLNAMGKSANGLTVAEMMGEVVKTLQKQENPIIMMDEADKLTDQVLYFFITLYNELEDECGLVLCATDHLEKRILRGIRLNKKGYQEIYSRIGRKFIELNGVGFTDVAQICMANGVEDQQTIKKIHGDCDGDLRRVKRLIYAVKKKNQNGNR